MSTRTRIGIFIFLVLIFASFYSVNDGFSQTREESFTDSEKIHPTIAEWQSSVEPETFAVSRSLSFSDNKIAVYIHLDSKESISNLPNDVEVLSSDENIVVAYLSSSQINQLAQLDFVERIAPPVLAVFRQDSRIPLIESPTNDFSKKIHPTIAEWQSSSNPETFAIANNLSFSDDKISVYIYLDTADSISNIPSEIDVRASDDNIVVAFVSSQQIDQLAQMVFVERIGPPILAKVPPLPLQTENDNDVSFVNIIIIIVIIVIATIIAVFIKKLKKNYLVRN